MAIGLNMSLPEILQKPYDFFYNDLSSEFEKAIRRLCKQKSKERRLIYSLLENYLAKFLFADAVLSLGIAFYFLPLKYLGQSLERDYRHNNC